MGNQKKYSTLQLFLHSKESFDAKTLEAAGKFYQPSPLQSSPDIRTPLFNNVESYYSNCNFTFDNNALKDFSNNLSL